MTSGRLCGRIGLAAEAAALAEDQGEGEARRTGVDVHRGAAGEVDGRQVVGDPATGVGTVPSSSVSVKSKTQWATGK